MWRCFWLLDNAAKFSPQSGTIEIKLRKIDSNVFFSVRDEGPGMSEEVQSHVFEKFYQGDNSRGTVGYGLGLALVKRIVTLCNGSLTVQSELGQGSTFGVMLPCAQ